MRLSLRHFLMVCLLLGAVAVPWGWKEYRVWRAAKHAAEEVERLQTELAELQAARPNQTYTPAGSITIVFDPRYKKWRGRVIRVMDRIEKLTGVRPQPEPNRQSFIFQT